MSKGIRAAVNHKFIEMAKLRIAGEFGSITEGTLSKGNRAFRVAVIEFAMDEFGISLASASTAYNYSFKFVSREIPELVVGLGRAEDKKGGRKPKQAQVEAVVEVKPKVYNVVRVKDGAIVSSGVSEEVANGLVEKATKQKKAKLSLVEC